MNVVRRMGMSIVAGVLMAGMSEAADTWKFPVGLSYIDGFSDVVSYYEDRYGADASGYVPIGISFTPYYQFDHGSRLGVDVGPAGVVIVTGGADSTYFDVPLALTYGFTFLPKASVSPYARGGIKYHIAGGDDVQDSKPGLFGAVGVEFMRQKRIGVQFEVGYDAAEVTLEGESSYYGGRYSSSEETITPGGLLVSVRAVF